MKFKVAAPRRSWESSTNSIQGFYFLNPVKGLGRAQAAVCSVGFESESLWGWGKTLLSQLNAARKICVPGRGFSQKFKNPKTVFAKIQKYVGPASLLFAKSSHSRKNQQIFAKISKFSQKKSANFRQKKKTINFRKNRYVFAKSATFSQKSVNFRKKIADFRKRKSQKSVSLLFSNFRDPGPQANSKIQKFSDFRVFAPNRIA